jgi:hypothetical protein
MLSVIMLSVIMLSVIMLSVMASFHLMIHLQLKNCFRFGIAAPTPTGAVVHVMSSAKAVCFFGVVRKIAREKSTAPPSSEKHLSLREKLR